MKKKLLIVAFALTILSGCAKERQCKCTTTDIPDDGLLKIIYVDHSMKCSSITEMGFEVVADDATTTPPTHTLQRTDMHKVSCRDYAQ